MMGLLRGSAARAIALWNLNLNACVRLMPRSGSSNAYSSGGWSCRFWERSLIPSSEFFLGEIGTDPLPSQAGLVGTVQIGCL